MRDPFFVISHSSIRHRFEKSLKHDTYEKGVSLSSAFLCLHRRRRRRRRRSSPPPARHRSLEEYALEVDDFEQRLVMQ